MEANYMYGGHWDKITMLYALLFYEHVQCSSSRFPLLILHIDSQINQGLIHFGWFTSVFHECTLSFTGSLIWLLHFKTQTFIFLCVPFTPHMSCRMSISRRKVWGVKKPQFLNTQLPTCPQCICLSFVFTDPIPKKCFCCTNGIAPFKINGAYH